MGKLHYMNRKIEGRKLGQVVSKDLLKRIPPAAGHKAALRDPTVDLDISGKLLTDGGFYAVATALATCVEHPGEGGAVVRLEEVCLKGNGLTAKSLRYLGKVVALATKDLRDLDLSNNLIQIATAEDAAAWEAFLKSFSNSSVLRRVDFSGNPLGRKAFEIFTRVYGRELSMDTQLSENSVLGTSDASITESRQTDTGDLGLRMKKMSVTFNGTSLKQGSEEINGTHLSGRDEESASLEKRPPSKQAQHGHSVYDITKGLRSVPYLIFSNTSMTDVGALYLSYVVACHKPVDILLSMVPAARAGPSAQQLEIYDKVPKCSGLIYLPNDAIGPTGTKVLELAEAARAGKYDILGEEDSSRGINGSATPAGGSRKASEAPYSPSTPMDRRKSTASIGSAESLTLCAPLSAVRAGEMDRARSRIQGDTIRDAGQQSDDLWRGSLEMLSVARSILLKPEMYETCNPGYRTTKSANESRAGQALAATRSGLIPLAAANPNQPIILRMPQHRKIGLPQPEIIAPLAKPLLQPSKLAPGRRYRSTLKGGLAEETWARILALAVDAECVLDDKQQLSVLRWAMERGTLVREMESLGKPESAQIWKVLEGMGCLAYEIRP